MEIKSQVICIGNEILLGHIKNTNASYISKNLSDVGIKTTRQLSISDDPEDIICSIKKSLMDSDVVVLSGGLGPTVDDLTLECISRALNKRLILRKEVANHIKRHFAKRKLNMPANNLRQAFIPEGARYILNNIGSAPGLIIPLQQKVLIALPGVPFELYPMFKKTILPYLIKRFRPDRIIKSRVIKITGLPESKVNEKIEDILKISGSVQMGIYPHPEEITVKITVTEKSRKKADTVIKKIENKIKTRLKDYIFGYDDDRLEEIAGNLLLKRKMTLSIAESCTGGLLSSRITDTPGSSKYFRMGLVTYSNASKNKFLGIPLKTIREYGAVSKNIATLMAKNMRSLTKTDVGIGITGIAGPTGATKKKPVGLVYIALSSKRKTICKEFRFLGQRDIVKHKTTQMALDIIRKYLP